MVFIILLLVPLATISILSVSNTNDFSSDMTETSSEALIEREEVSIAHITSEKAKFVGEVFEYSEGLVNIMADYATELWANPDDWGTRMSYYHDATAGDSPPDVFFDKDEYKTAVSLTYSCYKLAPDVFSGSHLNIDASVQRSINISANMDYIFQSTKGANPDFAWVYMGMETGVHRSFPWHGPYSADYDPRARGWYKEAKKANGLISWSDPYMDASGRGLMISCSKAVYTEKGELIGVVAADLTIETINQNILSVKVGQTGYAFLVDAVGNVVAHQGLDETGTSIHITQLETTDKGFQDLVNDMTNDGSDVVEVNYPQGNKYVSYSPVSSIGYSVAIVVPSHEITEPIDEAKEEISSESASAITKLILISIFFIIIVVVVGIFIAIRMVRPIKQLTNVAGMITQGNYNASISVGTNDEISVLADSFKNILITLRLGNTSYYKGDLKKALENYKEALVLFETTDNRKGIGMCYNNMGNIYRNWGEYGLAKDYFKKALDIAKKINDKHGLAVRNNNLGILMKAQGNRRGALEFYKKALKIDRELEDDRSISMRMNNIGLIYMEYDVNKAVDQFEKALSIDERCRNKRGKGNSLNNLGKAYLQKQMYDEAMAYLQEALRIGGELNDPKMVSTSYHLIAEYYRGIGDLVMEKETLDAADEVSLFVKPPKTVIFVVDKSGSMTSQRINAVRAGAVELVNNRIYDKDKVGVIEFDDDPNIVCKPIVAANNREKIISKILSITPNPPFGMTAFYDAIGYAVRLLSQTAVGDMHWIVALTDGEDNKSEHFAPKTEKSGFRVKRKGIRDLMGEIALDATIVVLGVGEEIAGVEQDLKYLCKDGGYYIKIGLGHDVHESITNAFKDVERLFAEQEEIEGYTPEEY